VQPTLGAADPTGATSLPSFTKIVSAVVVAGIAVSQSVPAANAGGGDGF
jgi:hypothetical protein